MILHVTFSDGSNPWVCFSEDRHEIAKHWRRWTKNHPTTAKPEVFHRGRAVRPMWCGSKIIGYFLEHTENREKHRTYKHLGHALNALERLGGERP